MCVACRRRRPKGELLRFLLSPAGVKLDPTGKKPGRGAYVCKDSPSCFEEKALRRFAKGQARALSEAIKAFIGGAHGQNTDLPAG